MNFINSPKNCTEVRFASFFPSGFITAKVVNPQKRELTGIKKPTGKVGKVQNLTSEGISSPSPEEDNLWPKTSPKSKKKPKVQKSPKSKKKLKVKKKNQKSKKKLTSEGISSPSPEEDSLCLRVTSSIEPVEDTEAILDNAEELKN